MSERRKKERTKGPEAKPFSVALTNTGPTRWIVHSVARSRTDDAILHSCRDHLLSSHSTPASGIVDTQLTVRGSVASLARNG